VFHPPSPLVSSQRGRTTRRRSIRGPFGVGLLAALLATSVLASCTDDPQPSATPTSSGKAATVSCAPKTVPPAITATDVDGADTSGTTVTLVTHDSFATTKGIFDSFTEKTGIKVKLLQSGDAGTLVSQSILTAGKPVADVLYGIDNTFLCRGARAGLFVPYAPAALADVAKANQLEPDHLVTPIDVGDVCLNYAKKAYPDGTPAPADLADLTKKAYAGQFVTENPETSSPGLAFLLATIARFGPDGWQDYWKKLKANGVKVDDGWESAYEGSGSFGSGTGKRPIVTSYATSPVADVVYADPPRTTTAVAVVPDSCFRQVEFAGVLRGTKHEAAAAQLVDFLLSPTFQQDIPLNMFVEPANTKAKVPAEFEKYRTPITHPLTLTPAEIEAGRDRWTEAWNRIVTQ